jgi:signal transduction histidine kinase
MKALIHSFYARLSAIFLLLILLLGAGCIAIAFNSAEHLVDEVGQLINRDYARDLAAELQPLVADEFMEARISGVIHYMMVLNPMVEIYLVNGVGSILAYFTHPTEEIIRNAIDIAPLEAFVERRDDRLILGDDPRTAARRKPFSAAPLRMGEEAGYVYVILGGQSYDRSVEAIRDSYYLRAAFVAFLLALATTLVAGLSLFFLLTRRLRSLSQAVRAFEIGELQRRVDARGQDEVGALGRAFNDMAATIESDVEKLKLAERLQKELIANISHDLRSPLASIRGYLETIILKDTQLTREQRREFLEISLRSVYSFQELVEELFELVMLEAKQVKPALEAFQLAELTQDIVLKLKTQADNGSVSLVLDSPEDLPPVCADIRMIERALTNLIENALHFTPSGGAVRLSLTQEEGKVRISVADTGSGIEPEDISLVFERFYHASRNGDRSKGGTGLGLAIAKQIVELHGGDLRVESRVGEGTRFHFTLFPC